MFNYTKLAIKIFGSLSAKYEKSFIFIKNNLAKADIKKTLVAYVSIAFLTSVLVFVFSLIISIFLMIITQNIFFKLLLLTIPVLSFAFCFLIFMYYPSFKANSRRKNIETNLPFVLTHMGSIAESGIPPHIIFRLIGSFNEYGEIAKEFRKISRNIDTFGVDPLTAIRSVAMKSPSEIFKQMLLGFVTTTESGGNIKVYLKSAGERALFEWRMRREKFLNQLSTYAEIYTGLMIAAPLFIISLLVVMGMISQAGMASATIAGFDMVKLTALSIYVVVPLMNIGFLLFLRGVEVEI